MQIQIQWKKNITYLFRLMVCIALLYYIFIKYDTTSIMIRLQGTHIHWMILALLFMYVGILLRSWRWKGILHVYDQNISLLRLFCLWLQGAFLNLFFPGFIAGDLSRIARTSNKGILSIEATLAVFLERFSGLVIGCIYVGFIALIGGYEALGQTLYNTIAFSVFLMLFLVLFLLNVRRVRLISRFLPGPLGRRAEEMAQKMQYSINIVTSHPVLLWRLGMLSLLFILSMVGVAYLVTLSIDLSIPLYILLAYGPLVALLANLPISVAGIGVRENLAVFFYSITLGYPTGDIIAFALLQSALLVLVNLSGGIAMLSRLTLSSSKSWVEPSIHCGKQS